MNAKTLRRRVAVLISGRGSNMRALVEAARAADYPAEIVRVICNRPGAAGLDWARAQGLAVSLVDHKNYPDRAAFDAALHNTLEGDGIELVALAGFMRLMTAEFVDRWRGRMINIHPSLLPAFKGLDVQKRAIEATAKISGCTVHFVTPEMDEGPIIMQAAVPIVTGDTPDTLAARILVAEHKIYPQALAAVAGGAITFERPQFSEGAGAVNQEDVLISPKVI